MTDSAALAITEIFGEAAITGDPAALKEAFDSVTRMLQRDDKGWIPIVGGNWGNDEQYGLKLDDLKRWSKRIREAIAAAPWIGRGFRLRANEIWSEGARYGNVPKGGSQGVKDIQKIIDRELNQFFFFGAEARRAREECLYADGVAFWIGNERTKDLEAIPLWQIDDVFLDPNQLGHAWGYLRKWTETDPVTGKTTPQARWYFTDRFVSKRVKSIKREGDANSTPVDQNHIIFDLHASRSTGLVFGVPDALAAWVWNGIARDAVGDGRAMMQALATFAFKASTKNAQAGQNAAIQLATPQTAGSTYVSGQTNDLVPMSNAGKGYDFKSLMFLVAIVAAALDVSVVSLTANPADAGSSYSAANALDRPSRLAMEARRQVHVDFDKRVLRWMGVGDPDVSFLPFLAGDEVYRKIQGLVLEYQQDTMTRQELRDRFDDLMGRPDGEVPGEADRPSALAAKALAKAAPKPQPTTPSGNQQVAAPDQGKSNGTGGQGNSANDIRRGGK